MIRKVLAALAVSLIAGCGGGGGGGGGAAGGGPAITFSSTATVSVAENTTAAFYTAAAAGGAGAIAYTISGADAARFAITSGGVLSFVAAPDFEAPTDANRDNLYQLNIVAAAGGSTGTLALTVTVTDVAGGLAVRRVATGFSSPLFLAGLPDDSTRALVVQRGGLVRILTIATGAIATTPFLDVSTQILTDGERGLLGLAFAPDFATSRTFYIYLINTGGAIEVRRYRTLTGDPNRADPATSDPVIVVPHPRTNHVGGWLGFGQDGFLYIGTGDGGGAGDPDGNGQNRNTLLGKILRIDPRTDSFPADTNRDYAIPPGNPFATAGGAPEVFAFGLRNPFRASFDRQTGNLYIGDVGQGAVEEIDLIRSGTDVGLNFGWNILEGTAVFAGGSTAGLQPPVAEYAHGAGAFQGRSVTGGVVYRGPVVQFRGQYLFGDFINPRLWTVPVASLVQGQTVPGNPGFTDRTAAFAPNVGAINNIAAFGEDAQGNLFIVDFDGEIFMLTEND